MPDLAVGLMQSATLELNKSGALHNAQTNQALATEPKGTCIFANGNSVEDGVGPQLEWPKKYSVLLFFLLRQHLFTAQFH